MRRLGLPLKTVMRNGNSKVLVFGWVATLSVLLVMGTAIFSTHKDLGKKVYDTSCASCHGDDGRGDTRAGKMMKTPDLLEVEWKMGTELPEVVKMLEDGIGKMPKYKGKLSDEELKAVSEYTLKLSGKLD